jgi:transposase InsO family protein
VARIVRTAGLSRLRSLEPRPAVIRYERQRPGELLHIDIKKLARLDGIGHRMSGSRRGQKRGLGYDFVHVCIDDASRMTYVEILPDERGTTAAGFVRRAVGWFARRGITTERVMTDNGACYISGDFAAALGAAGIRHVRTRPYTSRTNGKAERLIQTLLRE